MVCNAMLIKLLHRFISAYERQARAVTNGQYFENHARSYLFNEWLRPFNVLGLHNCRIFKLVHILQCGLDCFSMGHSRIATSVVESKGFRIYLDYRVNIIQRLYLYVVYL